MEEPRFIESGRLLIAGFSFFGDPFRQAAGWDEDNEIGILWKRWIAYFQRSYAQIPHLLQPDTMYEIHIEHEETQEKGVYEIFAGVEVGTLDSLPPQVLVKVLPATTYAVFFLRGAEITGDWTQEIYARWLSASEYESTGQYMIQRYGPRFLGMDRLEESVLDVLIPVEPRSRGHAG
jgi:predicted transcriptional regulator YdeE